MTQRGAIDVKIGKCHCAWMDFGNSQLKELVVTEKKICNFLQQETLSREVGEYKKKLSERQ
jgi:hypothetical protein